MTTQNRDIWPALIPLGMAGLLGAVAIGVTVARNTAQPQAQTTSSPVPVSSTVPTVSPSPASSPTASPAVPGLVKVKQSPNGCTPAFDGPSGEQLLCFESGTFKATGEQDGYTHLSDGVNAFWMQTASLEPVTEKPPAQLLPPEPKTNWN